MNPTERKKLTRLIERNNREAEELEQRAKKLRVSPICQKCDRLDYDFLLIGEQVEIICKEFKHLFDCFPETCLAFREIKK